MDQKDSSYDNTADSSVVSASPKHSTRTRFLLLSDTHSHPLHPTGTTEYAYRSPLSHADVLIHAGDLSFSGRIEQYRRTLDVIKASDAELKLVIAGNHDLTLDEAYTTHQYVEDEHQRHEVRTREMRVLDEARGLWTGQAAREAGVVYLEEGLRKFTLRNGTQFTVYASPYTPAFCNMAFAYERDEDRFNPPDQSPSDNPDFVAPNPVPSASEASIDIMITHGPPKYHMDGVTEYTTKGPRDMHVGCINQLHALARVRPKLSVFGHIHEGWGAEWVNWTANREHSEENETARKTTKLEIGSSDEEVLEKGYAYINASSSAGLGGRSSGPKWGEQSLLVNAAILSKGGDPINAPWVVDLDL